MNPRTKDSRARVVLEARGLEVPRNIRAILLGCSDLERLDAWLKRAVSVEDASELL